MHRSYRGDIDGLRAIAVVSVFIFHLFPLRFPGGALGVDAFFVISGYLIGGNIIRDLDGSSFSFSKFFIHRILRIAPALLFVILVVEIAAGLIFLPSEVVLVGISAISAVLSASNIYFWSIVNYFDQSSASMPLLHTWSLGVEEQFYLIIPVLLFCMRRLEARYSRAALIGVCLVSYIFSSLTFQQFPAGNFFLIFSRSWELILGVLLNYLPRQNIEKRVGGAIGLAALFILLLSMYFIDPSSGWPRAIAILPCLSVCALLVINSDSQNISSKCLSIMPMTAIGKASYSIYLWHWPIIVFTRFVLANETSRGSVVPVSIVLTAIMGFLSWRFIEQPFRYAKAKYSTIAVAYLVVSSFIGVMGWWFVVDKGFPERFSPKVRALAAFEGRYDPKGRGCLFGVSGIPRPPAYCLSLDKNRTNVVLIGDSHAAMIRSAVERKWNVNVLQITAVACPVESMFDRSQQSSCLKYLRRSFGLLDKRKIDAIFLASRWTKINGENVKNAVNNLQKIAPVVIIGPTPEYRMKVPILLALAEDRRNTELPKQSLDMNVISLDRGLSDLSYKLNTKYMSSVKSLCNQDAREYCKISQAGIPIYSDRDHLTLLGSKILLDGFAWSPPPAKNCAQKVNQ